MLLDDRQVGRGDRRAGHGQGSRLEPLGPRSARRRPSAIAAPSGATVWCTESVPSGCTRSGSPATSVPSRSARRWRRREVRRPVATSASWPAPDRAGRPGQRAPPDRPPRERSWNGISCEPTDRQCTVALPSRTIGTRPVSRTSSSTPTNGSWLRRSSTWTLKCASKFDGKVISDVEARGRVDLERPDRSGRRPSSRTRPSRRTAPCWR